MGKALYRKYRPKNLAEVIGQQHITTTLANAIKAGKISHAYLLTGPRGVGKTSIARILAHEINELPYDDQSAHLDIIEIDAASNRRIDEIRDLRDKVHVLPTQAKYKVYIIDEVHMLTREAFNALLKTLEEPPEHAVFILATTEAHKLPETIVSRTQHFSFKPIEVATLVEHLRGLTKSEKVKIDDAALELIAEHGDGSFRDSISLLDQARSISDDITAADIQALLGVAPASALQELIETVQGADTKKLFSVLAQLRDQGLQSSVLAKQLSGKIRQLIIDDSAYQNVRTTGLLTSLLGVTASQHPDRTLEIVLLEYMFANQPNESSAANPQPAAPKATPAKPAAEQAPKTVTSDKPTKQTARQPAAEAAPKLVVEDVSPPKPMASENSASAEAGEEFSEAAWPLVVAEVKKTNNTLYGILRMAQALYDGQTLTLTFGFPFHQKQIKEAKNRQIIEDIIKRQTGSNVTIEAIVAKKTKPGTTQAPSNDIQNVSNIFGGAEVIES